MSIKQTDKNTKLHNKRQNKSRRYLESHDKNKMKVGWTRSVHEGQYMDSNMYKSERGRNQEVDREEDGMMTTNIGKGRLDLEK